MGAPFNQNEDPDSSSSYVQTEDELVHMLEDDTIADELDERFLEVVAINKVGREERMTKRVRLSERGTHLDERHVDIFYSASFATVFEEDYQKKEEEIAESKES